MSKKRIGIDIGSDELKLAVWNGKAVKKTVRVVMPAGMMENGAIVSHKKMGKFIRKTMRKNHLHGSKCSIVLPSSHVILRRFTIAELPHKQLLFNLPFEFRDYLTEDKEAYYFDYAVIRKAGVNGELLDIVAAAIPKTDIRNYISMAKSAKMKLVTAVPTELAFANILKYSPEAAGGECAFLDMGHFSFRLHIFKDGVFEVTRIVNMGMADVYNAIRDSFEVDEATARDLCQSNDESVENSEYVRRVYAEIAADVRKAVNFYLFNSKESDSLRVWICGGNTEITSLHSAICQAEKIDLRPTEELLTDAFAKMTVSTMAAVGAAIQ